jgi:predicted MFS family arabinose efflux permease
MGAVGQPVRVAGVLAPYLGLFRLPGTLKFSASGLLARIPMPMVSLGIVLLVSARTGSYGIAGAVSATYVVCRSIGSPLQARWVDRYGQHRILPIAAIIHAAGLCGVVLAAGAGGTVSLYVLAALAGASSPTIGSYVRARWSHVLGSSSRLQTAFALEAVVDELLFMIGPPIVTFLATAVNGSAALVVAMVCGLVGTLAFASLRSTEPPAHGRGGGRTRTQPLGWRLLLPLVLANAGIGTLFGSFDISVVALATAQDARSWAGVLLGICAGGSMVAAFVLGTLRLRTPPLRRFQIGAVALTCAVVPLPFVTDLRLFAVLVFALGLTISPTQVAATARVEQTVPVTRLSEGLAWTTSALVAGVALGSSVAGQVVDAHGASKGFVVCLVAGALASLAAMLSGDRPTPAPPTTASQEPGTVDHLARESSA